MIPNPWVLLGVAVAWLASLVAVGAWQRHDGALAEKTAWQARQTAELTAANAKIIELNDAARAKERESAASIAALGDAHARNLEALETRRRRDVADAHSGALRLRIPAAACNPGGGGVPGDPAAPGQPEAARTVELPRETAADLLGLANDADKVADKLRGCQEAYAAIEARFAR